LQKRPQSTLEPRKSPVQTRSGASVEAILRATIQVLRKVGKERLTTTRVAARARGFGRYTVNTLVEIAMALPNGKRGISESLANAYSLTIPRLQMWPKAARRRAEWPICAECRSPRDDAKRSIMSHKRHRRMMDAGATRLPSMLLCRKVDQE
jgi:hypothetical protein